jgi:hypothetical protein
MNRPQKIPPRIVRDPAYRQALQRIEESLERAKDRKDSLSELEENAKIDVIRMKLFGVLAE